MKFTKGAANPTVPGEIVYAVWLPTKTNAVKNGVKIYVPNGTLVASSITMKVGDINGVRERLAVAQDAQGDYVMVNITEMPLFIQLGNEQYDRTIVAPTIDRTATEGVSCDAIRVKLVSGLPSGGFLRAYYYENIKIHDNTIKGQNASGVSILSISTVQNTNIQRNRLEFNQYEKDFNAYNKGIQMTLLENSTIARNFIKGIVNDPNDYRNSATNVGIFSINSRNNIVSCNRIDDARIGMQFRFNNTFGPYGLYGNAGLGSLGDGNLGADTLSQYAIGLKIDSFAEVGTQRHRRNVWNSPLQHQYHADALFSEFPFRRVERELL